MKAETMKTDIAEMSIRTIRKTILWQVISKELPDIIDSLEIVQQAASHEDAWRFPYLPLDFAFAIYRAPNIDKSAWQPWITIMFAQLALRTAQGDFQTSQQYLDIWKTIIDSLHQVLDLSHDNPQPPEN